MSAVYPEHEKLKAVASQSQAVGAFLDWLSHEKDATIATHHRHADGCYLSDDGRARRYAQCDRRDGELIPLGVGIRDLLAEFFEIDQEKLEGEKRAMLDELRNTIAVAGTR